jgi:hypothetical protein
LEVDHPPLAVANYAARRLFITDEYARVERVPVLFYDRVLVGYCDPLCTLNVCGIVVLIFFGDTANVKW